jgi:hypothetical protein
VLFFFIASPPLLAFLATNGRASFAHLLLQQFNAGLNWLSFWLGRVSANQLAFAALAVVVLLNPFYKFIVTACRKHGIADVFDPRNWLTKQKELVKLLREAFAVPIEDVTPDGSANHATVPPRAEVDTTTSNPGPNQT